MRMVSYVEKMPKNFNILQKYINGGGGGASV
jgi:hypothetical protein